MSRIEEYDDGYDSAASFERAGADRPEDCEDPADHEPSACECDNTHQANNTVCRWCWAQGLRNWGDTFPQRLGSLNEP